MRYLSQKNFECSRCGDCCRAYSVLLDEEDIKKITALGFKEDEFISIDPFENNQKTLKKKKDSHDCIFLETKGKMSFCKIYENRPKTCRTYPFFGKKITTCKPDVLVKEYLLYKK